MPTVTNRLLGYARVSTQGQDLTYQLGKLKAAGCQKIFYEKRSGKNCTERPQLNKLLAAIHPGDLVLATSTDRVARDPVDLLNTLQTVKQAGAGLRFLDEPFIDTTSEMADLIMFLIGWAARLQRRRILENTAHGRELARKRGVRFGRPAKLAPIEINKIFKRYKQGDTVAKLARDFEVSETTVYRRLMRNQF